MISSVNHITTFASPELEPYKTLRRPFEHMAQGIFVAEGEKVVLRLLDSRITIQSLLLSQEWFDLYRTTIEKNSCAIKIFIGKKKKLLETIVGHVLHQSIMGLGTVPAPMTSDQIISRRVPEHRFFVVVDGITNAENMGVIVRNCACFNVDAVMVLPTSCDPFLRRSVRNSMGNIFQMPIVYIRNISEEIKKLQENGIRFYAAHPDKKSTDIRHAEFSKNCAVVFGAEGHGISNEVLELCDECVTIPMKEGVDSLNVASASAIMLYEIMKKR